MARPVYAPLDKLVKSALSKGAVLSVRIGDGVPVRALSVRTAIRRQHKHSCVGLVGKLERLTLFTSAYYADVTELVYVSDLKSEF